MGELFEKEGFSTSDGDISNLLDPLSGWRLPTQSEWESIVGDTRAGSTVNGTAGIHYAGVYLTGVTYTDTSNPYGLLLFPDNETFTGKALDGMDDDLVDSTSLTLFELSAYLGSGCVFLPASGYCDVDSDWYAGGGDGNYWSSSESGENSAHYLCFNDSCFYSGESDTKSYIVYSVRLVKPVE